MIPAWARRGYLAWRREAEKRAALRGARSRYLIPIRAESLEDDEIVRVIAYSVPEQARSMGVDKSLYRRPGAMVRMPVPREPMVRFDEALAAAPVPIETVDVSLEKVWSQTRAAIHGHRLPLWSIESEISNGLVGAGFIDPQEAAKCPRRDERPEKHCG